VGPRADKKLEMPTVTCFYCSSPANQEMLVQLGGKQLFLHLCGQHASERRKDEVPDTRAVARERLARPKRLRRLRFPLGSAD
jgi:hypothetical protein